MHRRVMSRGLWWTWTRKLIACSGKKEKRKKEKRIVAPDLVLLNSAFFYQFLVWSWALQTFSYGKDVEETAVQRLNWSGLDQTKKGRLRSDRYPVRHWVLSFHPNSICTSTKPIWASSIKKARRKRGGIHPFPLLFPSTSKRKISFFKKNVL